MNKIKILAKQILKAHTDFDGPYASKYLADYPRGTFIYPTLGDAQAACSVRDDCGGVTHESHNNRFTLRTGVELFSSSPVETSWLLRRDHQISVANDNGWCNQLLRQFHRVDEELSVQGKWQGGSVTGVCRGWGTTKVRSAYLVWADRAIVE
jgi:hypothetical protein